jgi:colicin import membrane protein
MQELWAQTKAFGLAVGVHVLMAALVVLGTMDWKPFKPPTLTGMTIEAVMVDTSVIKQRREEAKLEAERAIARKAEQERRAKELEARKEREKREAEAERQRQKELAEKKREEDLRLQNLRKKQEQDRKEKLKKQQEEMDRLRKQREDANRQAKIEEERLKQLDARKRAEADAQRQALAEAELQRQMAAEFRAGQIATKGEEYYAAIQAQVTNNWFRPPTARPGLKCRLKIVQIPGGEVISAAIVGSCNADEATRRSLIAAVERTGTLPYRGFEEVFEREIDFIFTYDDE